MTATFRTRRVLVTALTLTTLAPTTPALSCAWTSPPPDASPPYPETLAAPTLSRQLELDMAVLFTVLRTEEGATYARYCVVARLSAGAVARRLGEALSAPWQPQPTEPTQPAANLRGPLGAPGRLSSFELSYLNEATAQSLSVRVRPIGRSNLFTIELRLAPTEQP